MKYQCIDEYAAVLFDAPSADEAADMPSREVHDFETRYGVKLLSGQVGDNKYPRWVYGSHNDPARADISPGDYIVTGPSGTRVITGRYFEEHFRQVED